MNRRAYVRFGLAVLAAVTWLGPRPSLGQNGGADPLVKAEKKVPSADPVTAAFAIPYGTVLNEKQRAEYERLKEDKASDLREAIAAVETAATPAEKADLQLEVSGSAEGDSSRHAADPGHALYRGNARAEEAGPGAVFFLRPGRQLRR